VEAGNARAGLGAPSSHRNAGSRISSGYFPDVMLCRGSVLSRSGACVVLGGLTEDVRPHLRNASAILHGYICSVASTDEFTALRRRVMRRCVYALNALALRDDRVPRDGAFDAAAANALAAIVAYMASGREYKSNGSWVQPPTALLAIVRREPEIKTDTLNNSELHTLGEGIEKAKLIRHGRADEEWDVLNKRHVDALISLDQHPALQVLEIVDGLDFTQAAVELYRTETEELMPFSPKERSMVPEPSECDYCGRMTLITEGSDVFGFDPGEGTCIACGRERTYDDTVHDYAWRVR